MNMTETIEWLKSERPKYPRTFYIMKKMEIVDVAIKSLWAIQEIKRKIETQKGLAGEPTESINLYREGKVFAYEDVLKIIDEVVDKIGQ